MSLTLTKIFKGKNVIITGAGSGLGRATAIELAKQGSNLTLVDLNLQSLTETKEIILENSLEVNLQLIEADVSEESSVKHYVEKSLSQHGRIDGLFNNAGILGERAPTEKYNSDVFVKVIEVNLLGVFYGLKHVLPVMKQQKYGSIVNTASVGGLRGLKNIPAYVATKHGVAGLTKSAAIEYAPFGISVNAIAPGPILTDMLIENFKISHKENWEKGVEAHAAQIPMKRLGKPEEVAKLVAFLLSGVSSFINGEIITIDGGQSASQYTITKVNH